MRKIDRIKKRFVEFGMDITLNGQKGSRIYTKKADGDFEAHLIALSCSDPLTPPLWFWRGVYQATVADPVTVKPSLGL